MKDTMTIARDVRDAAAAGRYGAQTTVDAAGTDDEYLVWLTRADMAAYKRLGVSIWDLADYCWNDDYESGMTPAEAVSAAIEAEFG